MVGMADGYRNDCKACNLAAKHERYMKNPGPMKERVKKWQQENSDRLNEYRRAYRARPERKLADRAGHLMRKFNLTLEEYDQMLAAQDGGCAICGDAPDDGKTFHIDHDHGTGEVRGLLCQRCNHALGLFRESSDLLYAAAEYVAKTEPERTRDIVWPRLQLVTG
jgi:hypothetical protein